MKTINQLAVFVALSSLSLASLAGDLAAGKVKAEACAGCHGADGNKVLNPSYPRLAGQHKDYLAAALIAYQRGSRNNAIMNAQAKQLSRVDIDNLSAYFASLPGQLDYRKK